MNVRLLSLTKLTGSFFYGNLLVLITNYLVLIVSPQAFFPSKNKKGIDVKSIKCVGNNKFHISAYCLLGIIVKALLVLPI